MAESCESLFKTPAEGRYPKNCAKLWQLWPAREVESDATLDRGSLTTRVGRGGLWHGHWWRKNGDRLRHDLERRRSVRNDLAIGVDDSLLPRADLKFSAAERPHMRASVQAAGP